LAGTTSIMTTAVMRCASKSHWAAHRCSLTSMGESVLMVDIAWGAVANCFAFRYDDSRRA
jgi:hypothetical protein